MIRFIFNFILILGVGYVITRVIDYYLSINSGGGHTQKDIAEMKSKLALEIASLVPMGLDEMDQLSLNSANKSDSQGITKLRTGVFKSIYNEPMLAYAFKEYKYPADKSLILVCTERDDFIYMTNGVNTKVYCNSEFLGNIDTKGRLHDPDVVGPVGKIEVGNILKVRPVTVKGRVVGEVINTVGTESPNPRVYQFIENMSKDELIVFQALSFLSIVEEKVYVA